MQLGAFSVSLSVKDLAASRAFYEALGFSVTGGDPAQNWLVMRSNGTVIGLFQGMFEGNLLTFNPGWDQHKQELPHFQDVRELQAELDTRGIELAVRTDPDGQGTGYLQLADPDGNVILIDQHVARPNGRGSGQPLPGWASTLVDERHANQGWHLPEHAQPPPGHANQGWHLPEHAQPPPRHANQGWHLPEHGQPPPG